MLKLLIQLNNIREPTYENMNFLFTFTLFCVYNLNLENINLVFLL